MIHTVYVRHQQKKDNEVFPTLLWKAVFGYETLLHVPPERHKHRTLDGMCILHSNNFFEFLEWIITCFDV